MKISVQAVIKLLSWAKAAKGFNHQFSLPMSALLLLVAQAHADVKPNARSNVLPLIKRLANDPLFPKIAPDSFRITTVDNTGSVGEVISQDSQKQAGGVIETQDVVLVFPENGAHIERINVDYSIRIPPRSALAESKTRQLALSFARNHLAPFWRVPGQVVELSNQENTVERTGVRSFRWKKQYKGLDTASLSIEMRVWDGKVVKAFYSSTPEVVSSLAKAKVTPEEATKKFLQHAQSSGGDKFTNFRVDSLNLLFFGKPSRLSYLARLKAESRREGTPVFAVDVLDATTGKYFSPILAFGARHQKYDSNFHVDDRLPVWTKQGLMFVSDRKLAGMPSWAAFGPQLFLQNSTGKLAYLTSDMKVSPQFAAGLSNSSWITVERASWNYALDLSTGSYRVLAHPERPAGQPAVDNAGQWSIVSSTAHSGTNLDLMPDNLQRSEQLGLRGRLVLPLGEEHHPIFSPDDRWIYFITSRQGKEKWTHSLRRIAAEVALTTELKQLEQNQVQTLVAALPAEVQRLSVFPDGKRLLLQTDQGMSVVVVSDGGLSAVLLKNLKDAELGGAAIQEMRDGWAGPTDDRVTFSGRTIDKSGKGRWRIYSCRMDGSGLKAHTSQDNNPVASYKFPAGERAALDLAKRWALGEIQFETELRQRER